MAEKPSGTDRLAPGSSEELWASIERSVRAERGLRGRLRSLPTPARVAVASLLLAATAALVALATARTDLDAYPVLRFTATLAILAAVALGAVLLFLRPLHLRAQRRNLVAAVVVVALLALTALALAPAAHSDLRGHPESFADHDENFVPKALACLVFGTILGLPTLLALALLDRREHRDGLRNLLLAATAALAGNIALQIHCPLVSPDHLLAGHATLPLLLVPAVFLATRWAVRRGRKKTGGAL